MRVSNVFKKTDTPKQSTSGKRNLDASRSPTPFDTILSFHSTLGNHAVQRLIESGALQTKLTVGAPNDIYEQEADRVADQVLRIPDTPVSGQPAIASRQRITPIQRMCPECEKELQKEEFGTEHGLYRQPQPNEDGELQLYRDARFPVNVVQRLCSECEHEVQKQEIESCGEPQGEAVEAGTIGEIQRQPAIEGASEDLLQTKGTSAETPPVTSDVESCIHAQRGGGQPLPASSRDFFGPRIGADFSGVRVHADAGADHLNRQLNARAFTTGQDIFFRRGEYNPSGSKGQTLLAHELTHVVQQNGAEVQGGTKDGMLRPKYARLSAHQPNHRNVQFKRYANQPSDTYEREADQIAERVVGRPELIAIGNPLVSQVIPTPSVMRTCIDCERKLQTEEFDDENEWKRDLLVNETEADPHSQSVMSDQGNEFHGLKTGESSIPSPKSPDSMSGIGDKAQISNLNPNATCTAQLTSMSKDEFFDGDMEEDEKELVQTKMVISRKGDVIHGEGNGGERCAGSRTKSDLQKMQSSQQLSRLAAGVDLNSDNKLSEGHTDPGGLAQGNRPVAPFLTTPSTNIQRLASFDEFDVNVLEQANALANALGGVVFFSGRKLVISVPSVDVCQALPELELCLGEIGGELDFLRGSLPINSIVSITGSVGLHVGFTPEVSFQLGPCRLHGFRIEIDPFSFMFPSLQGNLSVTVTASIGGQLRAGLHGGVGVQILWPDPPIPINIEVASIEAGLEGAAHGLLVNQVNFGASISQSGGNLSVRANHGLDLIIGADFGLAGYGQLEVLGANLCTLYWPFFDWHKYINITAGINASGSIGIGGVSVNVEIRLPQIEEISFEELPHHLQHKLFSDDCPICDALYAAGLMPSQSGGVWSGHPGPPWSGPLSVYARNPGIASGSLCRGACGPNCDTCSDPRDEIACEETADGHQFWIYPNFVECGSHQGCRDHDACYDWCAAGGERSIIGPCHRLCDLESVCRYGAGNSVQWIFGGGPKDAQMDFSDQPYINARCKSPCPEKLEGSDPPRYHVCLPNDIPLFDRKEFTKGKGGSTGNKRLYTKPLEVPYIGVIVINVFARGDLSASIGAGLGPAWLTNICLDVDPVANVYTGTAELHILAGLNGSASLTGTVWASADWFCLLEVVRISGGLTATGLGSLETEFINSVQVSCRGGDIALESNASFTPCLELGFDLDAFVDVKLFNRFTVISKDWNLIRKRWDKCWNTSIDVLTLPAGGGGVPAAGGTMDKAIPTFDAQSIDANELLSWLFSSAVGLQSTPTLPDDPATEVQESNPCDDEVEPCNDPLPILWPQELPLPPGIPPLQRRGSGEWDGDDRGPAQRRLADRIREARQRGLPPPSPCFADDAEPNQVYDAHHKQPLYLNGKDQEFNLCALENGLHGVGHRKLDNQSDMVDSDPIWIACRITEGRLRFHPSGQMYEIAGRK